MRIVAGAVRLFMELSAESVATVSPCRVLYV
jgi:hypothetical protein